MFLNLVIGLATFFAGFWFLQKKMGFDQELIYGLLAGSCFFNMISAISGIIISAIALSANGMLFGLAMALFSGYFSYTFAKRGNLIE